MYLPTFCVSLLLSLATPPKAGSRYTQSLTADQITLSNGKVQIGIDRKTGAIRRLFNKAAKTELVDPVAAARAGDVFNLVWSTWPLQGTDVKDPWSATGGTMVKTSRQKLSRHDFVHTDTGAVFTATYDKLFLETRALAIKVQYTIELRDDEQSIWRMFIENNDEGVISEVHFPVVGAVAPTAALLMPNHGGEQILDPARQLSDESPAISIEYPARASMQWFELYSSRAGLYMASYDRGLTYTKMNFARAPGGNTVAMSMVKFPFAASHSTWQSPDFALAVHAGDWHWGADRYRAWYRGWAQPPDVPKRIREMIGGGGGIYIKDRTEKTLNPYSALEAAAARVPASVENPSVMLIGWFHNGHDTFFPEYNAIEELGGSAALRAAVDNVHQKGAFVTGYMNGRLNNIETNTYKQFGKRWAVLGRTPGLGVGSINFFELHERWNPQWERDQRGQGWFSVMCPSAKGWQDHIVDQAVHVVRDYKFDGIFLDQPGSYYAELCFNRHHGHAGPSQAWGPGQIEIFRRVHEEARKLNPQFALSTEGMNDALGQYLDFHTDKNPLWQPMRTHPAARTFPEMWRYTLPDLVTQNGAVAYSFEPAQDKVHGPNYRFVLGIRGVGRGFGKNVIGTAEEVLALDKVVTSIERLWKKAGDVLFYGRFMDNVGLRVSSPELFARVYATADALAIALWNTGAEAKSFTVDCDTAALTDWPQGVGVTAERVGMDAGVPFRRRGRTLGVTLTLAPHAIEVVRIRRTNERE